MSNIVVGTPIKSMNLATLSKVRTIEEVFSSQTQVQLPTQHIIHGGMYSRTILLNEGEALTGAHIVIPTMLMVAGTVKVFTGNTFVVFEGYNVIPASSNRKQIMVALSTSFVTMVFPTDVTTVKEAEDVFTDEPHLLMSRHEDALNFTIITGE